MHAAFQVMIAHKKGSIATAEEDSSESDHVMLKRGSYQLGYSKAKQGREVRVGDNKYGRLPTFLCRHFESMVALKVFAMQA